MIVPTTLRPLASPFLFFLFILFFVGPPAKSQVLSLDETLPVSFEKAPALEIEIDVQPMAASLRQAPLENAMRATDSPFTVSLPMPDGRWQTFRVMSSPMMSEEFAQLQPDFKTYSLFDPADGHFAGRLFLSEFGVSALIFWEKGRVSINPIDYSKTTVHQVGFSKEKEPYECGVGEAEHILLKKNEDSQRSSFTPNGANKRTYDMAIVTTGEFYQEYDSTSAANAAVTAAVNNINAIYKRDLATEFSLLTPYHYTDPNTDPFNPAGSNRTNQAAAGVALHFASGTYDIGHCLHHISNGGSGVAYLGVVCNNNIIGGSPPSGFPANGPFKAGGWSGGNAVSDGFIGLFAHEVGHMFSAQHTFNGSEGNCGPNISATSAYEIGSGTTIMSYSGSCGSQNVPSSGLDDNYFHGKTLEQMLGYMVASGTCATQTATGNSPPTVNANSCSGSYTLPKRTPFTLTGSGTDSDGDQLYYTWEQIDEDGAGTPTQGFIGTTAGNSPIAPLFRSYPPTTDRARTFPALNFILENANVDNFEPLPNAARTLHFRLTGRDFLAVGGVSCSDVNVTVSSTAGPLSVTSPNGMNTWSPGSQTVTWAVNSTNSICANVDILLSLDGGQSFPVVLATNTPNDGSHSITLPEVPGTSNARVKVRCRVNDCFEFFDISDDDFTITADCDAVSTIISPDDEVTFPAGDPGLDLDLTNNLGVVVTSFAGTLTTADNSGTLVFLNGTPPSCVSGGNSIYYETHLFTVDVTGSYSFNKSSGAFGFVMHLYENSVTGSNCTNLIASSATRPSGTGPVNLANSVSATLTAGQVYYLMMGSFGSGFPPLPAAYTISFTKPSGANVYNGINNPPGYGYTYFAVNTANGQIAAHSATANFTALPVGSYCIYGASYKASGSPPPPIVNPTNLIGLTIAGVHAAGHCVNFSTNCKPVIVTNGGSCSLSSTGLANVQCNNNSTPTNGTDDYLTFTLNPVGTNLGVTYNVTVSAGSVTPTSANYGAPVNFNMQPGSANGGNFTVTVTDVSGGTCTVSATVTNPAPTYYADSDGDGYGNPSSTLRACSQPTGYVSNNTDCDDTDSNERPGQTWYLDADGDDYSPGTSVVQCLRPTNYYTAAELTATSGDCNDSNAAVNPGATEVCNSIDDDCDTMVDEGVTTTYYADADADGYGDPASPQEACSQPTGYVLDNTDNCPATYNPDQEDLDSNGTGDICQNCPVDLTIYPYAPVQTTFEAQQEITTSGDVTVQNGATRIYQATGILLEAGFEVEVGGVLDVLNQACTPLQGGTGKQE